MKINEAEALVGITRKNIRFYESEGLLTPRRNSENGYRDYGEAEIAVLRQIKLMRKLGVSLEEIRQMQKGTHTVGDGMRRHLVSLERDRKNLEESIALCTRLTNCQEWLSDLDAEAVLTEMTALEQTGTTFQDKQRRDVGIRYVAPVLVTLVMVLLMGSFVVLMLYAFKSSAMMPWPLVLVIIMLPLMIIAGMVYALVQRIQEIGKGEADDAKDY